MSAGRGASLPQASEADSESEAPHARPVMTLLRLGLFLFVFDANAWAE